MLYPDPGEYLVHYTHSNIRLDRSQLGGAPQLSAVFITIPLLHEMTVAWNLILLSETIYTRPKYVQRPYFFSQAVAA